MMLLDYRIGTVVKLTLNGVGVLCGMRNIGNVYFVEFPAEKYAELGVLCGTKFCGKHYNDVVNTIAATSNALMELYCLS